MGNASVLTTRDLEYQRQVPQESFLERSLHRIPEWMRNHFVAMMAEFMGTFLFL